MATAKSKMNPLNPANLPIPAGFNIEQTLINIQNVDVNTGEMKEDKYMPVAARLSWFIQNNPNCPTPIAEFIGDENGVVKFRAILSSPEGIVLSSGYGIELVSNYPDNQKHIAYQKAETQAIGRCLRNAGYGIAFDDGGNEGQPIDKAQIEGSVPSINEIIEDDETPNVTAKPNGQISRFNELSDIEKAVSVLETPFPFKMIAGGIDYKDKPLWEVLSVAKKTFGDIKNVCSKLEWGTEKGFKNVVDETNGTTYPEFVSFFNYLIEENKKLYSDALKEIKQKKYGK